MESQAKLEHSPSGHDRGNKYRQLIETEEFKELIQRKKLSCTCHSPLSCFLFCSANFSCL
ncbi:hypothetical protein COF64_19960 [Bacillus sp. AFS043905]|nr:hypothetical protein COF64_19960 [Bacillus sp. AFS043905]